MCRLAQSSTGKFHTLRSRPQEVILEQQAMVQGLHLPSCRMSRDQRVQDNWALLHAAEIASKTNSPVAVAFNLVRPLLWNPC